MRLIDADKLLENNNIQGATKYGNKNVQQENHSYSTMMMYEIAGIIEDAPTIEVPRWIPCSERLPAKHRDVFQVTVTRIQDGYKWVQSMLWNVDEWKWWEEDEEEIDDEYNKVIAWMPLPQAYTGKEE